MIKQIEHCPGCQTYTEGAPNYSLLRQATKKGASMCINKLLVWAVVNPIVGTFIFPVFGTFIDFIISFFIFFYVQNYSKNQSKKIDKKLYATTTYNFTCPNCSKSWSRVVETGVSNMPDQLIQEEKDNRIAAYKRIVMTKAVSLWGLSP